MEVKEADFQKIVINLAKMHGWLVHHPLPSMNRRGIWATHELGDHGFPDLVLAHPKGVLYSQNLKATKARSHRCNHDGYNARTRRSRKGVAAS
jgi:hypothetical protein